ncbi:MAG: ABC transporter ATP-binding protein [Cyanobacteria bacterium P01_H01_bin.21]
MTAPILSVSNVGKAYRQYGSEFARILAWFNVAAKPIQENWVLRDISFDVIPGDAVGIVGQNGAGKSTLLKLITGTQRPTTGQIHVSGRIGAILELGMGFNPDFTGRQNAYHSAGLMGFSQAEIDSVMPEIEAFAEIDDYFDQPVHTYSSGMQMRVAFSVITAFRPELLIVDEALAVGDAYFQHKSFNRIREFQKQGTSLLIVSHDRSAVQSLCDRAILLERGKIIQDGEPEAVFDYYNAIIAEKENETVEVKQLSDGKLQTTSGTGEARVESVALLNSDNEPIELVNVGQPISLEVNVRVYQDIPALVLGYMIKDRLGQTMYGTNTWHTKQIVSDLKQGTGLKYLVHFPANLGPGTYSISTALVSTETHLVNNYEWRDLAYVFEVINADKITFAGSAWIHPTIKIITE